MPILAIAGILVLIVIIVVLGPLLTIWSLNTLFGFKIAYSFWTWFATAWLATVVGGTRYVNKSQ